MVRMKRSKPSKFSNPSNWLVGSWILSFALSLTGMLGCGVSKTPLHNRRIDRLPELERPTKEVEGEGVLVLKSEELKLTGDSHEWKVNNMMRERGGDRYQRIRKEFSSPFQFNGWISLERVENLSRSCSQDQAKEPLFILTDDHGGEVLMVPGEKMAVSLEKLYAVRVEYFNDSLCQEIHIRFGVFYGLHE